MIAFKIIIGGLIVAVTTYIGFLVAKKLQKREETLRETILFFDMVENEIRYMLNVLPNAYESARQRLKGDLKIVIGQIVVDMLASDNYELSGKNISSNINLLKELTSYDKEVIISTLKNLGRSDVDAQVNILENAKRTIQVQIDEAIEYKNKNSKLYKAVGTIAGMMIVIILV